MKRRRVGVMGGSYNPVHIGHLMVADYVRQVGGFDQVWMMLSPLNPLKADKLDLADDGHRRAMLDIACSDCSGVEPSSFELGLPRPSYTIDTLSGLSKAYPESDFSIIIGSDNWLIFDKWKDGRKIIEEYGVTVYPRPGYDVDKSRLPHGVTLVEAPTVNLSASWVRKHIAKGFDVNIFLPRGVYNYIIQNNLYRDVDNA